MRAFYRKGKTVIGYLRGTLLEKQPPHVLLDVNGVGYELEVPMTTYFNCRLWVSR